MQGFPLSSLGAGRDGQVDAAAEDVVERAILVIDELTSNALRHAAPSSPHINGEDGLRIVTDAAPDRPPTPALGRPAGQRGYGLYVIADLTAAHGVHYETARTMVWACIAKPAGPSTPRP